MFTKLHSAIIYSRGLKIISRGYSVGKTHFSRFRLIYSQIKLFTVCFVKSK